MSDIIKQLREIRRAKEIAQEDLSADCGYHRQQIMRWENGISRPSLPVVCDWANALGYELTLRVKE